LIWAIFQFQPSEFAKLAFILAAAHFLSRPADELRQPWIFWKGIGLLLLPFALILKEPDLGSALVLLPTGLVMMFVAGTPRKYLLKLVGGSVCWPRCFWWTCCSCRRAGGRFRCSRISATAELQRLRQQQLDDEYNVRQALISVGSGGLTGKGWRQGTQNALGYLPRAVAHNDFIFSVIAEEEGFVGSVIVLTLYAVVLFTG
jgi:rod shape determining protein RodA